MLASLNYWSDIFPKEDVVQFSNTSLLIVGMLRTRASGIGAAASLQTYRLFCVVYQLLFIFQQLHSVHFLLDYDDNKGKVKCFSRGCKYTG